jgi:hypothetical protein
VTVIGGVLVRYEAASVRGDAIAPVQQLYCGRRDASLQFDVDQDVGSGVPVLFELHVVVEVDRDVFPGGQHIGCLWQRFEVWAIERLEELSSGLAPELLHGAQIQFVAQLRDPSVECLG